jgi:VWFA-related protein
MLVGFTQLSIISIFFLLSIDVGSQTQRPEQSELTVKIDTDLVVIDALIVSKKTGRVIGDLKREDFLLYEDGVQQEITHFSQDKLPLSIMLLLDVSGSVQPELRRIQDGARYAMEQLKPEDEVAVMVFASGAMLMQDFTKDRQLIEDKIAGIKDNPLGFRARNGTRINEGVYQAAVHMDQATNPLSRRVIIGVTDNKSSGIPTGHSGSEALEQLYESGSVVCGLIIERELFGGILGGNTPLGTLLGRIDSFADKTGGEVMKAKRDEIASKLVELIGHLRTRYTLGYTPVNSNLDGKFRKLELKVRPEVEAREGKVVVNTRRGYYARRKDRSSLNQPSNPPNIYGGRDLSDKENSTLATGSANQKTNHLQKPIVEQGSPEELKGVIKVFVDTNMEKLHRAEIVKEIQKQLPKLEVVPKAEDADIHLKFSLQSITQVWTEDIPLPGRPRPIRGVGKVVKVVSNDRVRLLLEYEEGRKKFGKRNPAEEFAKEFVKAYLRVN